MASVALKRLSSESVGLLPCVVSLLVASLGNHGQTSAERLYFGERVISWLPGLLVIASSQRNRTRETFWIINFGLLEIRKRFGGSEAAPALRVDWISSERKLCSISGAV